jgi:hypothetical protein
MDSSERASSDFVLDNVLIDMVLSLAILFIIHILGSSVERFLHSSMLGGIAAVMSERALVGWSGAARISTVIWASTGNRLNLQVLDYRRFAIIRIARNIKRNACADCCQGECLNEAEVELPTMRGENPNLSFFLGDIPRMAWLLAVTCEWIHDCVYCLLCAA